MSFITSRSAEHILFVTLCEESGF